MMQDLGLTFKSYVAFFQSFFPDTGDSILFTGKDLKILTANDQTSELFGISPEDLMGRDCRDLIALSGRHHLDRAVDELGNSENWAGELNCMRIDSDPFPVDMTIKQIRLENQPLYCIIIRDLTENKTLKEQLRREKGNRREMYVTMRNLMKAFDREKTGVERTISHKIETLLLPTLDKIKREPSADLRNTFLDILREQLIVLTKGFGTELDARFLTLTRTEMKICKLIQTGYSGKEIAEELNISFETIQTHRKNIRKKLGLRGRKVNLYSLLSSKSFFTNYTV